MMDRKISMETKTELIRVMPVQYHKSSKKQKAHILNQFIAVSGHHRKQAIRLLRCAKDGETIGKLPTILKSRRIYDEAVKEALIVLWEAADRICGKRLKAGKLKHLLAQFRYDFDDTTDNRGRLGLIVRELGDVFNIVLELRHRSWQQEDALKFLGELGVGVCNLDYPTIWNSFDMQNCTVGRFGYLRMHGRNKKAWFDKDAGRDETYNYYYDRSELEQIKLRIDQLSRAFEALTVIANNHYRGCEVANAIELKAILTGENQPVPQPLIKTYPELARIAAS